MKNKKLLAALSTVGIVAVVGLAVGVQGNLFSGWLYPQKGILRSLSLTKPLSKPASVVKGLKPNIPVSAVKKLVVKPVSVQKK